jgi:hypothetical protein
MGGVPVGTATVHRILTRPFYAGLIIWNGETYLGRHEPIISVEEFEHVQRMLRRPSAQKPHRHRFAYTGMIRCGTCGLLVTAEHKVNRYGAHYLYYHCTRRSFIAGCREPSVEVKALEAQVVEFLGRIALHPEVEPWVWRELTTDQATRRDEEEARRHSL